MVSATTRDAKKNTIGKAEAIQLARKSAFIISTKGTKIVKLNLRDGQVPDSEIEAAIIGPSGNLRAPCLLIGQMMLVGFDQSTYTDVLERSGVGVSPSTSATQLS